MSNESHACTHVRPPDMDVVFALAYNEGVSPVTVSLRQDVPLAGTPEADEILGLKAGREDKRAGARE